MVRRMRDRAYRAEQWRDRYASHIEPVNRLVEELGVQAAAGRPPYVAPMYRGVHAVALAMIGVEQVVHCGVRRLVAEPG
jgi:hypothetical protein